MPIIKTHTIRTMRDIWDEERRAIKKYGESAVFLKSRKAFVKQTEERFAKTKKYFLEHLELKRVAMDFLSDYQRYLGEGGFTKV